MTGKSRRFSPNPHAGRNSRRPRVPSRPPGPRSPSLRNSDNYRPPGPRSTNVPDRDNYRPTYDQRRAQADSQALSPHTPIRLARSRRGSAGGQQSHDRRHRSPSPCQRSRSVERAQRSVSTVQPLPPDHPLREEVHQLKNVRWKRRLEWVRLARRLGPDWELPGCQDRLQFRHEEEKGDERLCDLAVMVALEERGLLDSDPVFGKQKTLHGAAPGHHRTPSPLPNLEGRHRAKRNGQSNAANPFSKRESDNMITAWMQDAGNQAALRNMKPPVPLFIGEGDSEPACQDDVSLIDHQDLEADEREQGYVPARNEKVSLGSHSITPSRRPTVCLPSVDAKAASRTLSISSQTKEMSPSPALGSKIDIRLPKKLPKPQASHPQMDVEEADTANHRFTVKLPAPPIMSVPDVPEVEMTDQTHDLLPGAPWLARKAATSKASTKSDSPVKDMMLIDLRTPERDVNAESAVNQSDEVHTVSGGSVYVNIPAAPRAPLQPGFTASAMPTTTNKQPFDLAELLRSCKAARESAGAQLQGQAGERRQAGDKGQVDERKGQGDERGHNGAKERSFREDIDYKLLLDVLKGRK
jgi:hypothetical protein